MSPARLSTVLRRPCSPACSFWCPAPVCWTCLQAAASWASRRCPRGKKLHFCRPFVPDALAIVKANCKTAGVDRQSDIRQAEALPFWQTSAARLIWCCWTRRSITIPKRGTARPGRQSAIPGGVVLAAESESGAALPERAGGAGAGRILLRQDHGEPLRERGTGMNVEELLDLMEETLEAGTVCPFAPPSVWWMWTACGHHRRSAQQPA